MQEELAAAEAIIAEREKELEDYIPKGQLMKVAESNELKVRFPLLLLCRPNIQ